MEISEDQMQYMVRMYKRACEVRLAKGKKLRESTSTFSKWIATRARNSTGEKDLVGQLALDIFPDYSAIELEAKYALLVDEVDRPVISTEALEALYGRR